MVWLESQGESKAWDLQRLPNPCQFLETPHPQMIHWMEQLKQYARKMRTARLTVYPAQSYQELLLTNKLGRVILSLTHLDLFTKYQYFLMSHDVIPGV